MASWVPLEALGLYALVISSFVFSVLAVLFAYRLSRVTGLFGAWALLIAGLILTAFEDFAFFGSVVFVSFSKVEANVANYSISTALFAMLILMGIPALFFTSMYKLNGLFRSMQGKAPEKREAIPELREELVQ